MGSLLQILRNLGPSKILAVGIVMLGIMGFFAYLIGNASTPSFSLLYAQVEPNEAGRILEKLDAMGIPNQARGDGTQIYVPSDRVARIRMEMAQDGLPSGGGMGYEIFDKTDILSASGTMIDINRLRALEGELAKSIRSISGVSKARVHLVLPKRELFSRERSDPSASVVLKMNGSARLSPSQVQAVQHLVASAVPELQTDHIAIIDDKGTLLAKNHDGSSGGETVALQMDSRVGFENKMARTVEALLERSLGVGKVRVEVAADMDFDRVVINSEEYNPDGQVARSTTNTGENSSSNESGGQTVSVQNALPDGQGGSGGAKNSNTSKRTEENTNFEISKTVKTHHKEVGTVKMLSVAVLVDGVYTEVKDGKPTYAPRSQEELDKIKLLVKTAIGFKEDRGDKVEIINMAFPSTEVTNTPELALENPWMPKLDFTKIIQFCILAVVGFLVLMLIVRPMVTRMIGEIPEVAAAMGGMSAADLGGANNMSPQQIANQSNGAQGPGGMNAIGYSPQDAGNTYNNTQQGGQQGQSVGVGNDGGASSHLSESLMNVMRSGDGGVGKRIQPAAFNQAGEMIENYPEDVVSLLRTWMYEEPWKR